MRVFVVACTAAVLFGLASAFVLDNFVQTPVSLAFRTERRQKPVSGPGGPARPRRLLSGDPALTSDLRRQAAQVAAAAGRLSFMQEAYVFMRATHLQEGRAPRKSSRSGRKQSAVR